MQDEAQIIAKIITERVSIRHYLPDPVKKEDLDLILEAGRRAPSGENAQPWKFIVVQDETMRQTLGDLARQGSRRRFTGEYVNKVLEHRFATLQDQEKKKEVFDKLTSGNRFPPPCQCPLINRCSGLQTCVRYPL